VTERSGPLRVPELGSLQARRSQKWAEEADTVLSSTVAEMDFELAPPVLAALRAAIDRHDLGYTPSRTPGLSASFAAFAERRMRWHVDPEQVALVTDVMVGVSSLCRALVPQRGAVAFATPNYPPFFVELCPPGISLREVPLREDRSVDLEALDATLAAGASVFVLTSPHNPIGRVFPRGELEQIAAICNEHGAWVIADEIHAPLTLAGAEHIPWLEVSDAARRCGIAVTSASKAFNLAALKCAMVITASGRARDAVARLGGQTDHVGLLGVLAAQAAFDDGDEWLDQVLATLNANRALLAERLPVQLPGVAWTPPAASFLAWIDCRELGLGDDPAAAFLRDGGVALSPGLAYGASGAGFVRLNFGTDAELVGEMLRRMRSALADPEVATTVSRGRTGLGVRPRTS
jgi:cysteine-S-conjugate beta-lyase